ncbi:MAG TPA: hypothetical protein PLW65_05215 [Pseudomonadota bacterium]|nr:hypothetical protein [Pseudomonadota bacterium]
MNSTNQNQAYKLPTSVCIKKIPWLVHSSSASSKQWNPILDRLPSLQDTHAEIVHEFHADSPDGSYLLCERIEGDSLADILDRERRLPLEVVRSITRQAASALTAAHDLGLTHGNLSPSAIVIQRPASTDAEVSVKVRDFGLGKPLGPELFGALGYLAPEQVDPKEPRPEPTPLSDQFALAVIAFEMLAGRRAFIGDSIDEIAPKLREDPVHFQIQGVSKKESQRIISGLHKAMARLPGARFASLGEFVAALEARVQNPRSRASVLEASRLAPEHEPPLQLGSSVAKALVVASKRLPGPLDQVRPGQDAQTITLVRSTSTHTAQTATIPMLPRLELQVNVQTTIANKNESQVNVVLPPPVAPVVAAYHRLKERRVLFGLVLGAVLTAGLLWGFMRIKSDDAPSQGRPAQPPPALMDDVSEVVPPQPAVKAPAAAQPSRPAPADVHKPHPKTGSSTRPKLKKLALSCMSDNQLAKALNQQKSLCSNNLDEKSRGRELIIPYIVSADGRPIFDSNLPSRPPATLLRCLREFVTSAHKSEFGTLPKLGGVLRCTIN